jgi:hypothetical protein
MEVIMKTVKELLDQADLQVERGSYSKARRLYKRALVLKERQVGQHHPSLSPVLWDLGLVSYALGRNEEAQIILMRLLEAKIKEVGELHDDVKEIRGLLAELKPHTRTRLLFASA